jgi:hypothetical protein
MAMLELVEGFDMHRTCLVLDFQTLGILNLRNILTCQKYAALNLHKNQFADLQQLPGDQHIRTAKTAIFLNIQYKCM